MIDGKSMTLSEIFLLITNAVPLAGALFLGWDLYAIILIYWAESAVIGLFNVLKMIWIGGEKRGFLVPFFLVHYGVFMAVHLIFIVIFGLFYRGQSVPRVAFGIEVPHDASFLAAVLAMIISHGISFVRNFLGGREYLATSIELQMIAPYGRIMVMQVAVLASAFILVFTGFAWPVISVVILICLKTFLDLRAHRKERSKSEALTRPRSA